MNIIRITFEVCQYFMSISVSCVWQIPRKAQWADWRQRGTTYTQKEDSIIGHLSSSHTSAFSFYFEWFAVFLHVFITSQLSWFQVSFLETAFVIHIRHIYLYCLISVQSLIVDLIKVDSLVTFWMAHFWLFTVTGPIVIKANWSFVSAATLMYV